MNGKAVNFAIEEITHNFLFTFSLMKFLKIQIRIARQAETLPLLLKILLYAPGLYIDAFMPRKRECLKF